MKISKSVVITLALTGVTSAFAQRLDVRSFADLDRLPSGLSLDSLSVNIDYFNLSVPDSVQSTHGNPLGSVLGVGAGATVGWYDRKPRTNLEVRYSVAYNGFTRYTQLRGFDQEVSLVFRRKLTPKLEWDIVGDGQSTRLSQLLLVPSTPLSTAGEPGTFSDFSAGILNGTGYSLGSRANPSLAGSAGFDSPFLLAVSAARLYMGSIGSAFLYSVTPKLFVFGNTQARRLSYRQDQTSIDEGVSILPPHSAVAATSGVAYLIGRQTELGFDVDYDRSHAAFHVANAVDVELALSHNLGRRWYISGGGGPGEVILKSVGQSTTRSMGYVAHGIIGYKGLANSVTVSGQRSIGGRLGLGEEHTASGTVAWNRQGRGSPWTLSSSVTYERLSGGGGIRQLQGWLASVSLTRQLTPTTSVVIRLVNASDSAPTVGALNGITRRAASIALAWSPSSTHKYRRTE